MQGKAIKLCNFERKQRRNLLELFQIGNEALKNNHFVKTQKN